MSYSTPTSFKNRVGPRLYAQLTEESPALTGDDNVCQAKLDEASTEIDIRLGNRYVVPVTSAAWVLRLAGFEEQIALWFLWGAYRGIGEQESAASAAKADADRCFAFLDKVAAGDIDLAGATLRPADPTATSAGWSSNDVVYTSTMFRKF